MKIIKAILITLTILAAFTGIIIFGINYPLCIGVIGGVILSITIFRAVYNWDK